jgi:hypothetical protein
LTLFPYTTLFRSAASGTTPGSSSRSPVAELQRNLEPTLGFLEIAREKKFDIYDLMLDKPAPLAGRTLRFEVAERMAADGSVLEPLTDAAMACAEVAEIDMGGDLDFRLIARALHRTRDEVARPKARSQKSKSQATEQL